MENELQEEMYQERVADFFNNYEGYIIDEVIPESLAYYLSTAYDKNLLSTCPIINHLNSAIDVFNLPIKVTDELIVKVEEILVQKYNLKIASKEESIIVKVTE